jgi:hypothetical protein
MPRHTKIENPAVFRIKVTLKDIQPPIWRRFKVNNDITLNGLHQVLQRAMAQQKRLVARLTKENARLVADLNARLTTPPMASASEVQHSPTASKVGWPA